MLLGILVHACHETVDYLSLQKVALSYPLLGSLWNPVSYDLLVASDVLIVCSRPEILRRPAAGQSDVLKNQLRVIFHLRVSVPADNGTQIGTVDVRDAKFIPQNFGSTFHCIGL